MKIIKKQVIVKKPVGFFETIKCLFLGEWQTIEKQKLRSGNFLIHNCFWASAKLQEKLGVVGFFDKQTLQVVKVF